MGRSILEQDKPKPRFEKPPVERPQKGGAAAKRRPKVTAKKILLAILALLLAILIGGILLANAVLGRINYDDNIPNQYVASGQLERSMRVTNPGIFTTRIRETTQIQKYLFLWI